ncbi:4-alpha-glucanotransferase [Longibacter salinarum]|uniref:4-alpha-glucanotransferase n=1 Tax=Longibacter salinarum TaxID=1850348 RepID=A0A2A8D123_9BACT|nr:4-alpha-glucanotransferase [Longibacter salinarum]PEN14594.1 4-alpha-glucanotransferase [Longibacter salinarum]
MDSRRVSGILLHVTSLPGPYGIGDLGTSAHRFVDRLAETNQRIWQILPLGPVGHGASPYSALSTFANNPLLISPEPLLRDGILAEADVAPLAELPRDHVDFERLLPRKRRLLETAYQRFRQQQGDTDAFRTFREENAIWLDDFALFMALKDTHDGAPWHQWEKGLVHRDADALSLARERQQEAIRMHAYWQFLFDRQWSALHDHCKQQDIRIFGDIPIYVAHDSADTWANQDLFYLDDDGQPTSVAGVPPDYFSPEGQRWGNPLYRWDRMQENGFKWWIARVQQILQNVDLVRIDHFRGFEAYWEIPAEEQTAINGTWVDGPGSDIFDALKRAIGDLPVVAEDLGVITDDVRALRDEFEFPGMAIIQFAFGGEPDHSYLPHNYPRNVVAYTGTHDNNTLRGWWNGDMPENERDFARRYLATGGEDLVDRSLRALLSSPADRVVTPLQDVLELGADARMNTPGDVGENWRWRCTEDQLKDPRLDKLAELCWLYGRTETEESDA